MSVKCPKCQTDYHETSTFCADCDTPLPPADNTQAFFTRTQETSIEEFTQRALFEYRYEIINELDKYEMVKTLEV
jgi:predicted amidophosphoribosyltransferase